MLQLTQAQNKLLDRLVFPVSYATAFIYWIVIQWGSTDGVIGTIGMLIFAAVASLFTFWVAMLFLLVAALFLLAAALILMIPFAIVVYAIDTIKDYRQNASA